MRIRKYYRTLSGDEQTIGDATAVGDQLRGRQIFDVQHHTRREVNELRTAIGLDCNDLADAKRLLAKFQRITGRGPNRLQQLAIDPYFAARRDLARRCVLLPDRIGDAKVAA